MTLLGLDIGGTSVKAAWFRGNRCAGTAQSNQFARPTLDQLRAAITVAAPPRERIIAVGICLPGLYDPDAGKVTHSVNVPSLERLPIARFIGDALGLSRRVPVRVCNDALAAAYDIHRIRRTTGRLLVLALGTGVGAAVLDDGVPLGVDGDSPGHLGQMDVSIPGHDVIGPDGGRGGLEGYIGSPALARRHRGDLMEAVARYRGTEAPIRALVRALRIAHAIYRPQHICLCGGIGLALRRLLPAIRRHVAKDLTSVARPGWTLSCGEDLFHAARGAAWQAALRR